MKEKNRKELIKKLEMIGWDRKKALEELGIPESTYYYWRDIYRKRGLRGLKKICERNHIWNRLLENEKLTIERTAMDHPELSSRLLAIKITDEQNFSVSESTVYHILKKKNLINPIPLPEMPAAGEWRHKTKRVDEIWQCDASHMFVVGWGYYKFIPVLDDYSRKVLGCEVMPDETSYSISDAIEVAREEAISLGHKLDPAPKLLSDNGFGFRGSILEEYLQGHGIKHIYGKPYHPQTQGKVERLNRTVKQRTICLMVYCSPEELRQSIKKAIGEYNVRPHESLQNVSPNDVYMGRKEEILARRVEKKRLTIERRKMYNLARKKFEEDQEKQP